MKWKLYALLHIIWKNEVEKTKVWKKKKLGQRLHNVIEKICIKNYAQKWLLCIS